MLRRLAHICVETIDLEASETFYELLGARRQFEFRNLADDLIGMYMRFGGESYIELVKVAAPRDQGAVAHFALEVDNLDQFREQLLAGGLEVSDCIEGGDNTLMVTLNDPNGVFIELHQYTESSMQHTGGVCRIDYVP